MDQLPPIALNVPPPPGLAIISRITLQPCKIQVAAVMSSLNIHKKKLTFLRSLAMMLCLTVQKPRRKKTLSTNPSSHLNPTIMHPK
jgi:tRNA-binding EMAP/Myf-like protein